MSLTNVVLTSVKKADFEIAPRRNTKYTLVADAEDFEVTFDNLPESLRVIHKKAKVPYTFLKFKENGNDAVYTSRVGNLIFKNVGCFSVN